MSEEKFCPWSERLCSGESCDRYICPSPQARNEHNLPKGRVARAGHFGDGHTLNDNLRFERVYVGKALSRAVLSPFSYAAKYWGPHYAVQDETLMSKELAKRAGAMSWACALWGLSLGVVCVKILECAISRKFDARTADQLRSSIDAWIASGAPQRGEGP